MVRVIYPNRKDQFPLSLKIQINWRVECKFAFIITGFRGLTYH